MVSLSNKSSSFPAPSAPPKIELIDFRGIILVLVFFLATLRGDRISEFWTGYKVVLWWPVELMRVYSLYIIAGLMALYTCLHVLYLNKGGAIRFSWPMFFLLTFNGIEFTRQYSIGYTTSTEWLLSIGALLVLLVAIGVSKERSVTEATNRLVAIVLLAFIVFSIASLLELYFDRDNVFWNGRFNGVTSHPVFCGVISSFGGAAGVHLLLDRRLGAMWKILALYAALVGVAFIVMSGTRTGVVVFALIFAGVCLPHLRSSRIIAIAVVAALILGGIYFAFHLMEADGGIGESRIVSSENTRELAWQRLWKVFMENPFTGSPGQVGESSYLRILASGGLLGAIPFMIGIVMLSIRMAAVAFSPKLGKLGWPLVGWCIGLLALGVFEGYMLDQITYPFLVLLSTIAALYSVETNNLTPGRPPVATR